MRKKTTLTKKIVLTIALLAIGVYAMATSISQILKDGLQRAFDLIKKLEGRDGYKGGGMYAAVGDIVNVPTIGYGTTYYPDGTKVHIGDTCTEQQAVYYMQDEATKYYNTITQQTKINLTANQIAALTSFAYNEGISALLGSTLWRLLQDGAPLYTVAAEFDRWVFAGGQQVQGLVNRRAEEKKIFLT